MRSVDARAMQAVEGDLLHVAGAVAEHLDVTLNDIMEIVSRHVSVTFLQPSSDVWRAQQDPCSETVTMVPINASQYVSTVTVTPAGGPMAWLLRKVGVPKHLLLDASHYTVPNILD